LDYLIIIVVELLVHNGEFIISDSAIDFSDLRTDPVQPVNVMTKTSTMESSLYEFVNFVPYVF